MFRFEPRIVFPGYREVILTHQVRPASNYRGNSKWCKMWKYILLYTVILRLISLLKTELKLKLKPSQPSASSETKVCCSLLVIFRPQSCKVAVAPCLDRSDSAHSPLSLSHQILIVQMLELSLRLVVMWSVPFNLNIHDSCYSVWLVDSGHLNTNRRR